MTPGPNEPTRDQLQHLLKIVVDDLDMLYKDGVTIKTPKYPGGTYSWCLSLSVCALC